MEAKVSKHFQIYELVPKKTYQELGENAWKLISPKLIDIIDAVQEIFKDKKVVINNYQNPVIGIKDFQYRGLRTPECKEYSKTSQHAQVPLSAFDFNVIGLKVLTVNSTIIENSELLMKLGVRRMESAANAPTWTHLDCKETGKKTIHIFNAK
tara:strand:+ start:198 stop:656 length:459 start_codon:yes stop_codon:yes gene_type:complete